MFQISINCVEVVFSKFFSETDATRVLEAIPAETRRVVFLDTAATPVLIGVIENLQDRGIEVFVRDHHDIPSPRNPRDQEIAASVAKVRELLGSRAIISDRATHPACSMLIEGGEFDDSPWDTVIVADPDPDGLIAAMKALRILYFGLDADAAVLDGAHSEQTADRLTPLAMLLVKGMATLPPFNAERPQVSEDAKRKLFAEFVAAAYGDTAARKSLSRKVEVYEASVASAEAIAAEAVGLCDGAVMVNAAGKPRHDLATLASRLESRSGCKVTIVRKGEGPIAGKHGGIQISLAVVKAFQAEINLQELLPQGFVSSPEAGIISNTSFLLHVSETVWNEVVSPALTAKLAAA